MPNAYNNQANNFPRNNSGLAVGKRVQTKYGIGIITDIKRQTFGYDNSGNAFINSQYAPIIATIWVPGHPPIVFQQHFNTVVFTSNVGGEATGLAQYNNNL